MKRRPSAALLAALTLLFAACDLNAGSAGKVDPTATSKPGGKGTSPKPSTKPSTKASPSPTTSTGSPSAPASPVGGMGTISGKVVGSSFSALAGVEVAAGEVKAKTGADGTFKLENVPAGATSVVATLGDDTATLEAAVADGATVADLRLALDVPPPVETAGGPATRVLGWRTTLPATGLTFDVTQAAAPQYAPNPPDASFTLAAPPGSAGTTVKALEISYVYNTPERAKGSPPLPPLLLGPTKVTIAALEVKAGTETGWGPAAQLTVPIGANSVTAVFQAAAASRPAYIVAQVKLFDDKDAVVQNGNFAPLMLAVPIRGLQGLAPAVVPAVPPAGAPLPALAATGGPVPSVVGLLAVTPAAISVTAAGAFTPAPPDVTFAIAAPPGSRGVVVAAYDLSYVAGGVETTVVRIPIAPRLVRPSSGSKAGEATIFTLPVGSLLAPATLAAKGLKEIEAKVQLVDVNQFAVQGADFKPLVVSVPIRLK